MFKQHTLLLLLLAVIGSLNAQNFSGADKIGSAASVIAELKSISESSKNAKFSPKKFSVNSKGSLQASLKAFSNTATSTVYSGKISRKTSSNVSITVKNGTVSGTIVIPEDEKSYEYHTDASGNVYLQETEIHETFCVGIQEKKSVSSKSTSKSVTGAALFELQSRPGATAVVYLDFDGEYVESAHWNGGTPIPAERSWNNEEDILNAYKIVAEDFAPYDLNITTNRAIYDAAPAGKRNMVIFTSTTTAYPGSGGVAYIGSFTNTDFVPCWVFNYGGVAGGETASHEIGHVMGLFHDGYANPYGEYASGHNNWAPIMGVAFFDGYMGTWSKGEYANANNTYQDDVEIIGSNNGFGFVADETGGTVGSAEFLAYNNFGVVPQTENQYVITKSTDKDVFTFTTTGGQVYIDAQSAASFYTGWTQHPTSNLDIELSLLDINGNVIETVNPTDQLNALLNRVVPAGTYYIRIDGVGKGDPITDGYSDFSSIGRYSLSGTIEGAYRNDFSVRITSPEYDAQLIYTGSVTLKSNASSHPAAITKVEYFEGATKIGEATVSPYEVVWNNLSEGTHTIHAIATNAAGQTTTSGLVTFSAYQKLESENYTSFVPQLIYEYQEGNYTALPNFDAGTTLYKGLTSYISVDGIPKRNDNYAIRFKGYMHVYNEGLYKVVLKSDDGSKVYIGNRLVVNHDGQHAFTSKEGYVALASGYHAITLEYFDAAGNGDSLKIALIDVNGYEQYFGLYHKDIIPNNAAFYNNKKLLPGVKYEYNEGAYSQLPIFDNLTYKSVGGINSINLSIPNRRGDNFALRYTGFVNAPYSGEYYFYTTSDDGSNLYIDEQLVVSNDGLHGTVERSGIVWLMAGKHKIRVEYFEAAGGEVLSASYSGPGISKRVIPTSALFREALFGEQITWLEDPMRIPGSVTPEYFDQGGEGVSYHDLTAGNQLFYFRTTEDVDITYYPSHYPNYYISGIENGEWVEYTVNVTKTANYNIHITHSSGDGSSALRMEMDGVNITGSVNIPILPPYGYPWGSVAVHNVPLTAGTKVLRVYFEQGGFGLENITFLENEGCQQETANYKYSITPSANQLSATFDSKVNSSYVIFSYIVNSNGQLNYFMNKSGNRFTWNIDNVKPGDIVTYFFVYNYHGTGVQYETQRYSWIVGQGCTPPLRNTDDETLVSETEEEVIAYPNPFKNALNVNLSSYEDLEYVRLYSMNGRLAWEGQPNSENKFEITKTLPTGMYMLEWKSQNRVLHRKVTKVDAGL